MECAQIIDNFLSEEEIVSLTHEMKKMKFSTVDEIVKEKYWSGVDYGLLEASNAIIWTQNNVYKSLISGIDGFITYPPAHIMDIIFERVYDHALSTKLLNQPTKKTVTTHPPSC